MVNLYPKNIKIFELAEIQNDPDQIWGLLDCLGSREKRIIENRYGINGYVESTLDDIGKRFGLSRERIRQIEARAIKKMRDIYKDVLNHTIEDSCGLPARTRNVLRGAEINSIRDLTSLTPSKLAHMKGLGKISFTKITNFLESKGLSLKQEGK